MPPGVFIKDSVLDFCQLCSAIERERGDQRFLCFLLLLDLRVDEPEAVPCSVPGAGGALNIC